MEATYIATEQLAERIHYDARTIRTRLKDAVLLEGVHYIRPFGGRKLLFIWEAILRDIGKVSTSRGPMIPMANRASRRPWKRSSWRCASRCRCWRCRTAGCVGCGLCFRA